MSLTKEQRQQYYLEKRQRMIDYLGGKCKKCGDTSNLLFVHRDPATKLFPIVSNWGRRWEILQPELDKCDLICGLCKERMPSPAVIIHGTIAGWKNHLCKCEACADAYVRHLEKAAKEIHHGRYPALPPNDPRNRWKHGTVRGYTYYGCGCDMCREAYLEHLLGLKQAKTRQAKI